MGVELTLLTEVAYRGTEVIGARTQGLLALLAGDLRTGCSAIRLVDGLWPDEQPEHPAKALQLLVSRTRARLGAELIVSTPSGYRLSLGESAVDASAVVLHAAAMERAADQAEALEQAEAGLALFAVAPDPGSTLDDPLSALRSARVPTYRSLIRGRALALSRLGRHAEALESLKALNAEQPRDEELLGELLRSEAATVGAATALIRYDAYRQALRDDLGSDPGPALQDVYQDLLQSDAPLVRRGLRQEPNPLVGRDKDIAAVNDLLRTSRVTTIVGAGGLGKTRLAHAVGRDADQRLVQFVGLASVTTDADVLGEVASVLGVREGGPAAVRTDPVTGIAEAIGSGLLVLDNCEHVVRGAARLVESLVALSKDLRILATSRSPLGLSSESVYPLPELDLPAMSELFGQRARAIRPDVELPAAAVRELCDRLDGLPLAVELAAARVRVMSVAEIVSRLSDRFALLSGGVRDAPERHGTLSAVIDWSWDLLDPAGQAAMRALSVFPGGFTAVAARHVLGDDAVLEQLVDQSLLKVADGETETRFRMLETVREFSAVRRNESEPVVDRFLDWARDFGERQQNWDLAEGIAQVEQIRVEQDNLLEALRYALDRQDGPTVAASTAALGTLWVIESNFTRLETLLRDTTWTLSHVRPEPSGVEALRAAAVLAALFGYVTPDLSPLRALVALRRLPTAPPDTLLRAMHIALLAPGVADLEELSAGDEPLVAGVADYALSYIWEAVNDRERALRSARRMLEHMEKYGLPLIVGLAHGRVGELCLELGLGEPAFYHLDAALKLADELGWSPGYRARWALVQANLQRGEYDAAERDLAVRSRAEDTPADEEETFELCARAQILLGRGDVDGGLRLWREAADREYGAAVPATGMWPYEAQFVAVINHVRHDRVGELHRIVDSLPSKLSGMLDLALPVKYGVCGSLALALAVASDPVDVRMVAVALRLGLVATFYPTLSADWAAELARDVDGPAYGAAVASYAGLDPDGLISALRDLLSSDRV